METTTKKKGLFFKSKLTKSLSRVTNPRSAAAVTTTTTTCHQQCSKVVPYPYHSSNQPTGRSYEQLSVPVLPSSTHKAVSYASFRSPSFYDHNGLANETWGRGDENVDFKATSFISNVRERFKLET